MMETNTEPLKTIRDFIRYCTTRLYSSEATFNHGYQNPEEEAAFLVLRTLRIPLEYEDKFLDAALTNNERETVLNNISRPLRRSRTDSLHYERVVAHRFPLLRR